MSSTIIVNQALALLGATPITSLDDGTTQASIAKRLYNPVLRHVLEERPWTFAMDRAELAPDAEAPAYGFGKKFRLPNEALRVIYANDSVVQAGQEAYATPLDYAKEGDFLLADAEVLYVRYVKYTTDTSIMTAGFKDCLAYRLAAEMAIALTESRSIMVDMQGLYADKLMKAGSIDGAQGSREQKYVGRLVTRR